MLGNIMDNIDDEDIECNNKKDSSIELLIFRSSKITSIQNWTIHNQSNIKMLDLSDNLIFNLNVTHSLGIIKSVRNY